MELLVLAAFPTLAQWDVYEDFSNGIPEGWINEEGEWQWVEEGEAFPSPYLVSGDYSRALITTPIDVANTDHLVFQIRAYARVLEGHADIYYGFNQNGPWHLIWTTPEEYLTAREIATATLTDQELTGDTIYFKFDWDIGVDGGVTISIDDLRVSTHYAGWVDIQTTILASEIPAGGGFLEYELQLTNTMPHDLTNLKFMTFLHGPFWWENGWRGTITGPYESINYTLPSMTTITIPTMSQYVSADIEGGTYLLYTYVGYRNDPSLKVMDSMYFWKELTNTDYLNNLKQPDNCTLQNNSGSSSASNTYEEFSTTQGTEFGLASVFPNPFNTMTTVTVALPEASDLSVVVYNVMGKQVATLEDDRLNAGTHTFTFDASGMASGLYFVRATVPGELDAVQKVMLVR